MNYIQRLLDSAASAANVVRAPLAPPPLASSPVVAADQRLGLFPELADPFGLAAAPTELAPPAFGESGREGLAVGGPLADSAPERATIAPPPAPAGRRQPWPDDPTPSVAPDFPSHLPASSRPTRGPTTESERRRISPLQRLVELAPLDGPLGMPRAGERPVAPHATSATGRPTFQETPREGRAGAPTSRSEPRPALYVNPTEITPDQFTPRTEEARPAPLPEPAAVPTPLPLEPPAASPPRAEPLLPAAPLVPAHDDGPSPFARKPELPAPPQPRPDAGAPVPERIIERIREIQTTALVPPKAMTAAAQSVIGPLLGRHSGGWRPRQVDV